MALFMLVCCFILSNSFQWVEIFVGGLPISGCKVLDLTHALNSRTAYAPHYKPFNHTKVFRGSFAKVSFVAFDYISTYDHIGTHLDSPYHVSRDGLKINELPLSAQIGEACVVNISAKVAKNPDYYMTIADAEQWESENGKFDQSSIVLLYTGQQAYFWDMKRYFGTDDIAADISTFRFSAFSGDVAKWLVDKRHVKSVGVDAISLDGGKEGISFPAHVNFLHHGKIAGYENLNNLDKLPPRGATFFGVPLKITDGSGSPVRAFALGWQGKDDPCWKGNVISASEKSAISNYLLITVINIAAFLNLHLLF